MPKQITVRNFAGIREVTLHPTGNLVVIAGANGAGKSSLINAVAELFNSKGVKLYPKPIREGETEAYAEYVDEELGLRISRTWKRDGNAGTLNVEALDGARYSKPSEVIAQLTGGLIFDPLEFLQMDERRQRDALLAKVDLPFDIDALAREKAGAEQRRLEAGRDVKRLEGALASLARPAPDAPTAEVSAQEILDEIQAAQAFERDGDALQRSLAEADMAISTRQASVDRLERELTQARAALNQADDDRAAVAHELTHWLETPERPNLEVLRVRLAAVDETNTAVRAAREYSKVQADLAAHRSFQAAAQNDIDDIEEQKRAGLAAARFPVDGLSVDESGVTFDGIPFGQVNSAARRRVAFAIATAGDPKLRLVIVKDGDLLDADSLAAIQEIADERGYTVLVERDRDESRRIGFTIEDGALEGAEPAASAPLVAVRRETVDDCTVCQKAEGVFPPHDPSQYCKSGSRKHCTCEVCF